MLDRLEHRLLILASVLCLAWMIVSIQAILMPFVLGALIGYLADPVVDRLELKGMSRSAGVCTVFLFLGLFITLFFMIVVPMLIKQISYIHMQVPAMIEWVGQKGVPWVVQALGRLGVELDPATLQWGALESQLREGAAQLNWGATTEYLKPMLSKLSQSGFALIGFFANLFLVPVVGFYLLRDWDLLMDKLRRLLPREIEPKLVSLTGECDDVLGAFLKGQLLVMLALGGIYTIGLWMVGLDLALLIGMMAGLASIVPYLGLVIGMTAALLASLFQFGDWFHPLMVVGVFGVGQVLESTVLTPILVGDRIGLHPVAVIFAVLAGAELFGFVGMLVALPVAAVILVLLRHMHEIYIASEFYEQRKPEAAESPIESPMEPSEAMTADLSAEQKSQS